MLGPISTEYGRRLGREKAVASARIALTAVDLAASSTGTAGHFTIVGGILGYVTRGAPCSQTSTHL
jgi:hypothetical protein